MPLGPFFVGQIPKDPMTLVIRDYRSNELVDLSDYESFEVKMVDPYGEPIDTSDGTPNILDPQDGVIQWAWPTGESVFSEAGEHRAQVILTTSGSVRDLAVPVEFEVHQAL